MQLYLLRVNELRMTILPQRVSGQYTLEYTDADGSLAPLLRINARDDQWYIAENSTLEIGLGRQTPGVFRQFALKENTLYPLRKDGSEVMILMVEPRSADRSRYRLYRIPENGVIDIGQGEFNRIRYRHSCVNEGRHVCIRYAGDTPVSVTDCEAELHTGRNNQVYLNGQRVRHTADAGLGDVVFLFGLKLILGCGFVAVNDPDGLTTVNLTPKTPVLCIPQDTEEDTAPPPAFSSAPRERREVIRRTIKVETPPAPLQENDTPWIVMLGPSLTMAMGSLFSSVLTINQLLTNGGSISSAAPSLVTAIVMVMGSAVWPIIGKRVQRRNQIRKAVIAEGDYKTHLDNLKAQIQKAAEEQSQILRENNPVLTACIDAIEQVRETLWERSLRSPDYLHAMIGTGDLPLEAEFTYPDRGYRSQMSQSAKDMYELMERSHTVADVPITVPLRDAGIVGVIGDREKLISFTKALLIELTALHSYEDLKIVFIHSEAEASQWRFVKWIPHLWNDERSFRFLAQTPDEVRQLSDYIAAVRRDRQDKNPGPHYLIFAADKDLAERAQAIKELCRSPEAANLTLIALYGEHSRLPKACARVIDLTHDADRARNPGKFDGVAATLADYNDITRRRTVCRHRIGYDGDPTALFVRMSNIHLDAAAQSKRLPTQCTFMDMFRVGRAEHLDLLRRWRENSAVDSLAAPIGIDADGYFIHLDIHEKVHGPHGVIAGMTGSGKSEFIISYIASLAINYSPEDVAFVLIDFKGGGMADIFKDLPHTAGLITNLDGNELKRSFLAIENELEKRQKLFKEISDRKKISNIDINKYQKLRREDPSLQPLPHLVLISDEFAELKQQHGDFMEQLIRIARIGRSLGVHLILATQKPDGVVNDQIKSNIRFKVCLKVQDRSDSQSMIDRPDATLITNPGRFYFQVGSDEVFEYGQSPWSGATYEPKEHAAKSPCDYIEVLSRQGQVIRRVSMAKGPRPAGVPEKQIDALVQFIGETARQNGLKAAKLWLQPLPAPKAAKKTAVHDTRIRPFVLNPVVGMYDDLLHQKHLPLTVPFTTQGNALLYGAAGSGQLEFVNRMLVSLMEHHSPEEVRFYLCDFDAGSLSAFDEAAHTACYVGAGDRFGAAQLLDTVLAELTHRRTVMRKFGGDYQTYVSASGKTVPNLLAVIHNYQNLAESDGEARQKLSQLAREGTKYGIFLLLTGTAASSIPYSMRPLFKSIYTLSQNSDDQYTELLGKTGGIVPEHCRGRGLVRVDGAVCEFQTDMVFEEEDNVYEAIRRFCREMNRKWQPARAEEAPEAAPLPEPERHLPYTLQAIPLAEGGKTFDLTAAGASILFYDEAHQSQKDSVLAAIRRAVPEDGTLLTLQTGAAELAQQIHGLWDMMLQRAKEGTAAKAQNLPIPQFPPVVILVREPARLAAALPESERVPLMSLIMKLTPAYRMFFVLDTPQESCTELLQGRCLGPSLPLKSGIVLTTDKRAGLLFARELEFRGYAGVPNGFLVQNGRAELAEIRDLSERSYANE